MDVEVSGVGKDSELIKARLLIWSFGPGEDNCDLGTKTISELGIVTNSVDDDK